VNCCISPLHLIVAKQYRRCVLFMEDYKFPQLQEFCRSTDGSFGLMISLLLK